MFRLIFFSVIFEYPLRQRSFSRCSLPWNAFWISEPPVLIGTAENPLGNTGVVAMVLDTIPKAPVIIFLLELQLGDAIRRRCSQTWVWSKTKARSLLTMLCHFQYEFVPMVYELHGRQGHSNARTRRSSLRNVQVFVLTQQLTAYS